MTQQAPHVADPYRTLGVRRAATEVEIKAAHRKLAKRFHPDAEGGDTRRFLRIQEAYRVLSDPLLRREWDARHAPGPIRADRGERPARPARKPSAPTRTAPSAEQAAAPSSRAQADDPRREPRSSRAYTWSAGEVPWWEEGVQRDAKASPRPGAAERSPDAGQRPADAPNEFDVYNRSSGAAWSMAARAYFRRGDQDLPRRGSFHHQGSQPLTAARARSAAEQERRRAAANAAAAAAATTAQSAPPPPQATAGATGQASAAHSSAYHAATHQAAAHGGPAQQPRVTPAAASARTGSPAPPAPEAGPARRRIVQRALPQPWPSVGQRLVYTLSAWLPFAAAIALSSSERIDEVMQGALMALTLGLLAAVPRLAYVLAVATLGLLVVGFLFIVALAWLGFPLPLSTGMTAAVAGALGLGYVATAGIVALGPPALRPWAREPERVRSR